MTDERPVEAVAVSPDDQSSDRAQADANFAVTSSALERLAASSDALSAKAEALSLSTAEEIRAARAQRRRFMIFMVAMVVVVVISLIGLFIQTSKGNDVLNGSKRARDTIINLTRTINSCVNPAGDCYRESQKRTAAAITHITQESAQVAALAASCAPTYVSLPLAQRQTAILSCILRGLQK